MEGINLAMGLRHVNGRTDSRSSLTGALRAYYADGTEEPYDHTKDPNEWTSPSARPEHGRLILDRIVIKTGSVDGFLGKWQNLTQQGVMRIAGAHPVNVAQRCKHGK